MAQKVNAQKFGLSGRTDLEKTGKNHYSIIINRKSRLVLKDGESILEKVAQIHEFVPGVKVDVITTAPVCQKTKLLLKEHQIDIIIKSN